MSEFPQNERITMFYEAFRALDAEAMQAAYAPDAIFDDEAFALRGREEIGAMWRMLCTAVKEKGRSNWKLAFSDIDCDDEVGVAHWEAHYRFSATGRMVHNIIDAEFAFDKNGLITRHRDRFDFWRWSKQALGLPGILFGWTPLLRNKVRAQAAVNLAKFRSAKR
ncbi:MAG: nuclear transport factor 2 family protein [Rhodanobacteraceae bacterium]|nr:nuclear transport factor 2 family protein [Rhodanobacteraceae bacterium]MBP9153507.1 nuclear transport factor 2 family protein [Xanthomonadales bacterium]HQW80506.1 nuclear transport factor 2 family protein [Pseudomonadota bacterium]